MITLLDGPAAGSELALTCAPIGLRICVDRHGHVRALETSHDTAQPDELIYVYVLATRPEFGYNPGSCQLGPSGGYLLYPHQPHDSEIRGNGNWHHWCFNNEAALMEYFKRVMEATAGGVA